MLPYKIIHNYPDYVVIFVKNTPRYSSVTIKQAKQKKAMEVLGIKTDSVFWNEDYGQFQTIQRK